ncbi:MAG: glycosyltransferase [Cyclobacteriaceae bacterium]|nr:glycosyltransferase [Cyclobacteriaceae bacterium]
MNILFYTISEKRSRDIESQAIAFAKEGHSIFLFTQSGPSALHDFFRSHKFKARYSKPVKTIFPLYVVIEMAKLVWISYRYRIDVIHAHLDPCCLIAVQAQIFLRAKVIVTRHHADALQYEASPKYQQISRNIYAKAKTIVAVSQNVKQFMVQHEGIDADKITVVPLAYYFDLYEKPNAVTITALKNLYKAQLLFCTVGRLTGLKRIDRIIEFIDKLLKEGIDCKLIIVGQGPEEEKLKRQVVDLGLDDRIFFTGFSDNVLTYIAAAHYYLHFSVSEATCTVVKEAALVGTPVVVCEHVGDFDHYIQHKQNGYKVSKTDPVTSAIMLFQEIHNQEHERLVVGARLTDTVLSFFSIERVMPQYKVLHDKVVNVAL